MILVKEYFLTFFVLLDDFTVYMKGGKSLFNYGKFLSFVYNFFISILMNRV